MGRWTQYDEDSYRLPDGVERIGYDSDTGRYLFRAGGSVLQGAQGAEFSEMTRVSEGPEGSSSSYPPDEDVEAAPRRSDGYQALPTNTNGRSINAGAYRTIFPFFLLIGVVLLLVWRLILSPGLAPPKNPCPPDTTSYLVEPGDSCWEISSTHGCSLDEFKKLNNKLDCDRLLPGSTVCLPSVASNPA
ncbi:hypothetical protein B0H19DRAFT_1173714 [Mycena capillaripes]|nr:hypothetical protein B0H19DRAFT_1173714 [Mycena capillaripes]